MNPAARDDLWKYGFVAVAAGILGAVAGGALAAVAWADEDVDAGLRDRTTGTQLARLISAGRAPVGQASLVAQQAWYELGREGWAGSPILAAGGEMPSGVVMWRTKEALRALGEGRR